MSENVNVPIKPIITIGIPCYDGVSAETLSDYMRFAYYLGRRYTEYDFYLAIKSKSEQFRARNNIVEAALQVGSKYLLMIDDDHVIDIEDSLAVSTNYEFLRTLITHMENRPKAGVIGAMYYHRGGECRPVIMKKGHDDKYFYLRDDEIEYRLQEVDVQGGGCMLLNMKIFEDIPYPWFEPEIAIGTDLQISTKAKEHGYGVYCDTSIEIGHVMSSREVITHKNRHRVLSENMVKVNSVVSPESDAMTKHALAQYLEDAETYLEMGIEDMVVFADRYQDQWHKFEQYENKEDYYREAGKEQLARQVVFHHQAPMVQQAKFILSLINEGVSKYGVDYGCGSAPIGMELAMRGNRMDFIDIDGAGAYEFTKWRAKYRHIENRVGWKLEGPYDFALFLDSIEHFQDWKTIIKNVIDRLKPNGCIITNYFTNVDFENKEHINMDTEEVWRYIVSLDVYPLNHIVWIKRDMNVMCQRKPIEEREQEKQEVCV